MQRVGFYLRAGAFLIDLAIFAVVSNVAGFFELYLNLNIGWSQFGVILVGAAWLTLAGYALLEIALARSPGKMLLGLKIADEQGQRPRRRALMGRAGFKYFPMLPALFSMVTYTILADDSFSSYVRDGLTALFWADTIVGVGVMTYIVIGCFLALKPGEQAAHDRAAGTAVFRMIPGQATRGFAPVLAME